MVDKLPFVRDGVFFAVAIASIVGTLVTGTVTLSQASAISAVYVVYVLAGGPPAAPQPTCEAPRFFRLSCSSFKTNVATCIIFLL